MAYIGVLMNLSEGEPLYIAGLASILVGAIGGLNQTKIKRLLAYSGIGHIGFMLIGVGVSSIESIQATIIYMIIYIVMTISAFTIALNMTKIAELRGISRRNGVLGLTLGVLLMSIAGVPPMGGFYSKYLILQSAIEQNLYVIVAIMLSVVSGFYYIRIIRYIYFEDQAEITAISDILSKNKAIILGITTYIMLTIMIYPNLLQELTLLIKV